MLLVVFIDEFFLMFCLWCSVENFYYIVYCEDVDKFFDNELDIDEEDDIDKDDVFYEFFIVI